MRGPLKSREKKNARECRAGARASFFAANSADLAFSRGTPSNARWKALGTNSMKKASVIDERSLEKSTKHRARASGEGASILFCS